MKYRKKLSFDQDKGQLTFSAIAHPPKTGKPKKEDLMKAGDTVYVVRKNTFKWKIKNPDHPFNCEYLIHEYKISTVVENKDGSLNRYLVGPIYTDTGKKTFFAYCAVAPNLCFRTIESAITYIEEKKKSKKKGGEK